MAELNFYECAVLRELTKRYENGIINRSLRQIARDLGGLTGQTIKSYLERFVDYGIFEVQNKGTHRQMFSFNDEAVKKLLSE